MIRKFEKNDINAVMEIWENDFKITNESIDQDTNEIKYTMIWNK